MGGLSCEKQLPEVNVNVCCDNPNIDKMRLRWGSRSGIVGKLCVSALALLPAVRAAVELNIDDDSK